jgi:hypothetical protein
MVHLFPFRTEKLSLLALMVLPFWGWESKSTPLLRASFLLEWGFFFAGNLRKVMVVLPCYREGRKGPFMKNSGSWINGRGTLDLNSFIRCWFHWKIALGIAAAAPNDSEGMLGLQRKARPQQPRRSMIFLRINGYWLVRERPTHFEITETMISHSENSILNSLVVRFHLSMFPRNCGFCVH